MSAKAPDGRVNMNSGRLTATWTNETVIGLASRLVIIQPEAVSNMAVPTFDNRLALHMTVNAIYPKAPHRDPTDCGGLADELSSATKQVSMGGVHGEPTERFLRRPANRSYRDLLKGAAHKLRSTRSQANDRIRSRCLEPNVREGCFF